VDVYQPEDPEQPADSSRLRPPDPWSELERKPATPLTAATLLLVPPSPVRPTPTEPGPADRTVAEPRPIQPFVPAADPSPVAVPGGRVAPLALIAIPVIVILLAAGVFQLNQGPGRRPAAASLVVTSRPPPAVTTGENENQEGTEDERTWDDRTTDEGTVAVGTGPQAGYPCSSETTAPGADLLTIGSPPPSGVEPYRQWWRNTEQIETLTFGDRSWRATVRSGTANLWDLLVVHSCLPVQTGRTYSLAFTASAGTAITLRARVQDRAPPDYTASLQQDVLVGPEPRRWTLPFTGAWTSPAGELSFQIGGNPDAEIQVTDIVLIATP
jgi:hypothetical protein